MTGRTWTIELLALAAADFGAWDYDVASGRVRWSEKIAEFYGIPLASFEGTFEDFVARIHPEDRATVAAAIGHAVQHGPDEWRIEHRVAGAGPERWLAGTGRVYRDAEGRAVRMAGIAQDCTERRRAEREDLEQRRLMQAALDASLFAVVVLEPGGRIIYCNRLAASLLGLAPSAVEGCRYDEPRWRFSALDGGPWPGEHLPFARVMATGEAVHGVEFAIARPDGRRTALRVNAEPVHDDQGAIRLVVVSFEDVTARLEAERGQLHSRKMEAVGRLAGGVAHDFNNLLTVISGHAESLLRDRPGDAGLQADLSEIVDAARRGASLTGQLLAFSRKQVVSPAVLDLDAVLARAARLLRRLIGEDVELVCSPGGDGARVLADAFQLEQVLVNLALNARDAMPSGGVLSFRTARFPLDDAAARRLPGARAGEYVRLEVADTGTGIAPDVLPHVFEPFYTTKESGRGTGLGLAIVHGIVEQNGGFVTVHSTPGSGTTFAVHLPVTAAPAPGPRPELAKPAGARGEQVLIVEDEAGVLSVTERLLSSAGFRVATALHPAIALDLVREGLEPDLLLTDVVMPGMNGLQLHEQLRALLPGLRVVYMSGHTQDVLSGSGVQGPGTAFVQKPFALATLLEAVRGTLDAESPAPGEPDAVPGVKG